MQPKERGRQMKFALLCVLSVDYTVPEGGDLIAVNAKCPGLGTNF